MQPINFFLSSVVAYFGIVIGILLIKIAPEEQQPLKKYFSFAKKIILALIFLFSILYFVFDKFFFALIIILFIISLIVELREKQITRHFFQIFGLLGIIFFLSSINNNFFAITSSLIFIYGMVSASLMKKHQLKYAYASLVFLIVSNVLYSGF